MKTRALDAFWSAIHDHAARRHRPLRVLFELTYRCNFRCRHCYVPPAWRRRRELDTREVFGLLRSLRDAGCLFLGFTGGEVFLRSDLFKILEFARRQGMQVLLYTNGSLVSRGAAKRLAGLGVNKVDITLPGLSEEVFDAVTGLPGSRRRTFAAIEALREQGVPLGFKTCALKANEDELRAIEEFCAGLGCPHRLDDGPSVRIDGSRAPLRFAPKAGRSAPPARRFRCASGVSQCAITPQGRLKLCPLVHWPGLDAGRGRFQAAWESLPRLLSEKPDRPEDRPAYACPGCTVIRGGARA